MNRVSSRTLASVLVAATGLSLAWGVNAQAESQQMSAQLAALDKAETKAVAKIAKKVAKAQIKKAAPTLTVAKATTADTATNATNATNAQNAAHATSADMATNAQNAANAAKVGGLDVKKVNLAVADDAADVAVLSTSGLTINASCDGGVPRLVATGSGGRLRSAALNGDDSVWTNGSSNLASVNLLNGTSFIGSVTAEYVSPTGAVVNVWLGFREDSPDCVFFGNYMVG